MLLKNLSYDVFDFITMDSLRVLFNRHIWIAWNSILCLLRYREPYDQKFEEFHIDDSTPIK